MFRLSLEEMLDGVALVRQSYDKSTENGNRNLARYRLLDILDTFVALIRQLKKEDYAENELKPMMNAVYLLGLHTIAAEPQHWFHDPEYKPGTIYSTGSRVYSELLLRGGVTQAEIKALTKTQHLIALCPISEAFTKHEILFTKLLERTGYQLGFVQNMVIEPLQRVLHAIDMQPFLNAIPVDVFIQHNMEDMLLNYCLRSKVLDPAQIQLLKIAMACNQLLPVESGAVEKGCLSGTQLIRTGLLLVIMQSRAKELWFWQYPRNNDVIYDMCCDMLNLKNGIEDLPEELRLSCLYALDWLQSSKAEIEKRVKVMSTGSFIDNFLLYQNMEQNECEEVRKKMEEAKKYYVVNSIENLLMHKENMINTIKKSHSSDISTGAITMALLTAMFTRVGGCAFGIVLSTFMEHSDMIVGTKVQLGKITNGMLRRFIGEEADGYAGYFVANMFIDATLECAFEQACEALAFLLGFGCAIVIYKASWETVAQIYDLCMKLRPYGELAQDIDKKFCECLQNLPKEVFDESKKQKMRYITRGTLFEYKKEEIARHAAWEDEASASDLDIEEESDSAQAFETGSPSFARSYLKI